MWVTPFLHSSSYLYKVVDQLDNTLFSLVQYKIPLSKHTWRILLKTTPPLVVAEFVEFEEAISEWRWIDAEFTQKYVHLLHKDQLLHFLLAKFQSFSINPPSSHKQRKGLTLATNKRMSKGPDGHEIGHGSVTVDATTKSEFDKLFPEQKKERLISIYYCSLWTSKIPIRGTLYVSDFTLCFSSSFLKNGIIIKFSDIRTLVKETHKSVNTVKITTNDTIYWFAVFFNREEIYQTLLQLWNLALRRVLKTAESMDNIFHNNTHLLHNSSTISGHSNTISPTKEELVSKYRDSNYQAKFRLPPTEILLEELTCKLLKGKTYRKGTLYISSGFICFYSLPYTPHNSVFSVVIPFQEIITMNISEEEYIEEGGISINIFTCTTQFSLQTPAYLELLELLQDLHNKLNSSNNNLQLDTPSIWQSSIPPRISSNMIHDPNSFSIEFVNKEEKLSEKWYLYTLKHGEGSTLKTNTLSKLVREGIPMNIRGKQWLLWGGGYNYLLRFPLNYYSSLLEDNKNNHTLAIEEIDKDLHRTCPEHEYYQSSNGIQSLRNVLVAYSWHNPTIGYCQSMNMVVSYLLLFLPEDQAFFLLCSICELLVPDYYIKQMLGSLVDQRIFEELLDEKCPIIHSHLKSIGLPLPMITLPWFLCLFIGYVPTEVSLRILDCFFYDGPNILFGFALALFKLHEADILAKDEGTQVINLLRQNVSNVDNLLSLALQEYSSIAVTTIDEKRLFQRSKAVKEMELKSKRAVLRELKKSTKFDLNELEAIYSNFISKSDNGHTLDYSQFDDILKYQVPGFNLSTLELAKYLDKKHTNVIQFTEFVTFMSLLLKGSIEDRLTHCFNVYCDESGLITLPMFKIMATLLYYLHNATKAPKKEKKDELIVDNDPFFSFVTVNQDLPLWSDDTLDQNFKDADVDQDNKLSFEDVQRVFLKNPIFALALEIE